METKRLYYNDPYQLDFTATVTGMTETDGRFLVTLDRTAFYPKSGGQPADTGFLAGLPVLDIYEQEQQIIHVLSVKPPAGPVQGKVDWSTRFDHMQQHAGQHILSQACLRQLGGETLSFHLGPEDCSIDIAVSDLTEAAAASVEDLANSIVGSGGKIIVYWVDPGETAGLNLRKNPSRRGKLRIVDIASFDICACGGTHPATTGEVGLIKIRKWEKVRGNIRLHFYCGNRSLRDYRWKNALINQFSQLLTLQDREVGDALLKIIESSKAARSEISLLQSRLHQYAATEMRTAAIPLGDLQVVQGVIDGATSAGLKEIANYLTLRPATVALLGNASAQLVFARSSDVPVDMVRLLRAVAPIIDGKGGGSPALAQGGGNRPERLPEAMTAALDRLTEEISG